MFCIIHHPARQVEIDFLATFNKWERWQRPGAGMEQCSRPRRNMRTTVARGRQQHLGCIRSFHLAAWTREVKGEATPPAALYVTHNRDKIYTQLTSTK